MNSVNIVSRQIRSEVREGIGNKQKLIIMYLSMGVSNVVDQHTDSDQMNSQISHQLPKLLNSAKILSVDWYRANLKAFATNADWNKILLLNCLKGEQQELPPCAQTLLHWEPLQSDCASVSLIGAGEQMSLICDRTQCYQLHCRLKVKWGEVTSLYSTIRSECKQLQQTHLPKGFVHQSKDTILYEM